MMMNAATLKIAAGDLLNIASPANPPDTISQRGARGLFNATHSAANELRLNVIINASTCRMLPSATANGSSAINPAARNAARRSINRSSSRNNTTRLIATTRMTGKRAASRYCARKRSHFRVLRIEFGQRGGQGVLSAERADAQRTEPHRDDARMAALNGGHEIARDNAPEKRIDRSTQCSSSGVTYRSSAPRRGSSARKKIARHNSTPVGDRIRCGDLAAKG